MYDLTLQQIVIRIGALLLIVLVHGVALAGAARLLEDCGPRQDGRLSPSPFVHVDLIGLISGVVFQLGWMRPMDLDPMRLRFRRSGLLLCCYASVVLVVIFGWLLQFLQTPAQAWLGDVGAQNAQLFLTETGRLALWFGLFNLLPIPPLTGALLWGAIDSRLLPVMRKYFFAGAALLLLLAYSGVVPKIMRPMFNNAALFLNIR